MNLPFSAEVISENESEKIAEEFSKILDDGDIVLLNGELGTGKTFFVKSVCSNYKINNVSSPSFALVNEYIGSKQIFHFDFYRIKKSEELYDLGIEDYFSNEHITFIEWAELFADVIPEKYYQINLSFIDNQKRGIQISKHE